MFDPYPVQTAGFPPFFPFISTRNPQTPQLLHKRGPVLTCPEMRPRAKSRATTECDVQSARCLGRLPEENPHASACRIQVPSQGFVMWPPPNERHRVGRSDLVSELTGLGWRNGGEGSSSARAERIVAHLGTSHFTRRLAWLAQAALRFSEAVASRQLAIRQGPGAKARGPGVSRRFFLGSSAIQSGDGHNTRSLCHNSFASRCWSAECGFDVILPSSTARRENLTTRTAQPAWVATAVPSDPPLAFGLRRMTPSKIQDGPDWPAFVRAESLISHPCWLSSPLVRRLGNDRSPLHAIANGQGDRPGSFPA